MLFAGGRRPDIFFHFLIGPESEEEEMEGRREKIVGLGNYPMYFSTITAVHTYGVLHKVFHSVQLCRDSGPWWTGEVITMFYLLLPRPFKSIAKFSFNIRYHFSLSVCPLFPSNQSFFCLSPIITPRQRCCIVLWSVALHAPTPWKFGEDSAGRQSFPSFSLF